MRYQNNLEDNKVQCTICPRNCKLKEGQRGFCHVRKNIKGKIHLTTYGYNTGLSIDPIEKKPLFHFLPMSKTLSFGTLGCNMGCFFCQNWHISKSKMDENFLNKTSPKEIAQIAKDKGCKSVSFTYNDPVIFFEYAIDTAIECHKIGLKTVAVTAGYINEEPRKEFFEHMDATNIDLKGFSDDFYKKSCMARLEPVLETIKYVGSLKNCWLELTTLLIEGENDSDEQLKHECEWILNNLGSDVPLHFSAFHPDYKLLNKTSTKPETLLRAYNIAKEMGLKYVYTGNIRNLKTSTTHCHNCLEQIIQRDCHDVLSYNLKEGNCKFCGAKCSGVFAPLGDFQ